MKPALYDNKDFLGGVFMISIGALALYMALDYPFGSALRMGPGFFPRVLACIFMAFGVFVLIRGLRRGETVQGRWGWKPLFFIIAALLVFGWTMEHLGFIPALIIMFTLATFGGHEFNWKEVVVLTIVMSTFATVVFVYLLGLPYPLWWGAQ